VTREKEGVREAEDLALKVFEKKVYISIGADLFCVFFANTVLRVYRIHPSVKMSCKRNSSSTDET